VSKMAHRSNERYFSYAPELRQYVSEQNDVGRPTRYAPTQIRQAMESHLDVTYCLVEPSYVAVPAENTRLGTPLARERARRMERAHNGDGVLQHGGRHEGETFTSGMKDEINAPRSPASPRRRAPWYPPGVVTSGDSSDDEGHANFDAPEVCRSARTASGANGGPSPRQRSLRGGELEELPDSGGPRAAARLPPRAVRTPSVDRTSSNGREASKPPGAWRRNRDAVDEIIRFFFLPCFCHMCCVRVCVYERERGGGEGGRER
jgi:hypothetical protein